MILSFDVTFSNTNNLTLADRMHALIAANRAVRTPKTLET